MNRLTVLLFISILIFIFSCKNETKIVAEKVYGKPGITFDGESFNFDTLNFKQRAIHIFRFINNGDQPLVIKNVIPTCGCTVAKFSKEPIMSGENSEIKVGYDTKRIGRFNKSIKVYTNTKEEAIVLKISGFVRNTD